MTTSVEMMHTWKVSVVSSVLETWVATSVALIHTPGLAASTSTTSSTTRGSGPVAAMPVEGRGLPPPDDGPLRLAPQWPYSCARRMAFNCEARS